MSESGTTCWSCGAARAPSDAAASGLRPSQAKPAPPSDAAAFGLRPSQAKPAPPYDPLCPSCGKVQPPVPGGSKDKFAVLGLPRVFALDDSALDERFRTLSRKLHPDRFARATARERRFSLEQTTALNDAYRTLQDPARRAEHLLELRGLRPLADTAMPEEFLEEAMEDREKLLEAKMEGGNDGVEHLANGIRAKRDAALAEIGSILGTPDPEAARLPRAAELLARLRYYRRYLDEAAGRVPEL